VTQVVGESSKGQLAWSRSSRLILLQAAGAAIVLWCLVVFLAYRVRDDIIEARRAEMAQTVSVVQEQADQIFTLLRVTLDAANQWIVKHPTSDPSRDPKFIQLVEGFKKSSGGRVDIRMITRDNKLAYAPFNAVAATTDVSDREYVQAQNDPARRGFHIASPVFSRVTKRWGIPVTLPVSTNQGHISLLFGAIELDSLFKLPNADVGSSGIAIAWIRNDGIILARRPLNPKFMGLSIAQSPDWVNHFSRERLGVFISDKAPTDGVARLVAFSHLDEYPVMALVAVPMHEILAPWQRQVAVLLFSALLLTAALGAVTFRLIRAVQAGERASLELERANDELMVLSVTDKLTQVFNRVRLDELLRSEMSRAARYGTPLSLALVDLDFFKHVNDEFGHAVGDDVLIRTADILSSNIRSEDTVGRWGGEEFMIILPQTEPDQAALVAEKIRSAIEAENFKIAGVRTASFGVTGFIPGDSEITILARADRALYAAKSQGRNRVVVDLGQQTAPATGG
jgi:diguanylate cyclase (GGDEF)-like protein